MCPWVCLCRFDCFTLVMCGVLFVKCVWTASRLSASIYLFIYLYDIILLFWIQYEGRCMLEHAGPLYIQYCFAHTCSSCRRLLTQSSTNCVIRELQHKYSTFRLHSVLLTSLYFQDMCGALFSYFLYSIKWAWYVLPVWGEKKVTTKKPQQVSSGLGNLLNLK